MRLFTDAAPIWPEKNVEKLRGLFQPRPLSYSILFFRHHIEIRFKEGLAVGSATPNDLHLKQRLSRLAEPFLLSRLGQDLMM